MITKSLKRFQYAICVTRHEERSDRDGVGLGAQEEKEGKPRSGEEERAEMMRLLPPHLVKQDEHPTRPDPGGFEDDNGSPRSRGANTRNLMRPALPPSSPGLARQCRHVKRTMGEPEYVRMCGERASECPAAADNLETFPLKSTDPPSPPLALRRTDERGMSVRVLTFTMSAISCN